MEEVRENLVGRPSLGKKEVPEIMKDGHNVETYLRRLEGTILHSRDVRPWNVTSRNEENVIDCVTNRESFEVRVQTSYVST